LIKINLLNSYKEMAQNAGGGSGGMSLRSDDEEKNRIFLDFIKRFIVIIIGPLGLYLYEAQTIPELQSKLNETNAKYKELKQFNDSKQGLAEEIKKYELAQARFTAQTDFINKIDRDKVNEYRLFEHLNNATPESVWINKLELSGNGLTISAESDSTKEIEQFILRLSNAEFIKNLIPIKQSNKKNFAGTDVTTIIMTLKADLNSEVTK
jgi:Tfp pilus assembly protein PilN